MPVPMREVPSFSSKCKVAPTPAYWQERDLFKGIQRAAREGYLPVVGVADTLAEVVAVAEFPAGWKAFGLVVPPSGKLHVRLQHPNEAWFRVTMSNKSGGLEKGMLQNLIPTGNPEATFVNPSATEGRVVYVIVDDPGWMSSKANPFRLKIDRSWKPGSFDPKGITLVQGIWAQKMEELVSTEKAAPSQPKP